MPWTRQLVDDVPGRLQFTIAEEMTACERLGRPRGMRQGSARTCLELDENLSVPKCFNWNQL